jgi:aldose 1-epimerase
MKLRMIALAGVASIALMAVFAPPISANAHGRSHPTTTTTVAPTTTTWPGSPWRHPTTTTTVAPTTTTTVPCAAPTITSTSAGTVNGQAVNLYTLTNCNGMVVNIFNYGGIIQSIDFPDAAGKVADVTLGYPTLADYVNYNSDANYNDPNGLGTYFGALIGRYANRIANGQFTLKGVTYNVPLNNDLTDANSTPIGGASLHGGYVGFDQQVWTPTVVPASGSGTTASVGLQLFYLSPNASEGYPGDLSTTATYTLNNMNQLQLSFKATTDMPTVLNLTNHTYWNLAGEASGPVYNQTLYINANSYMPVNSIQVPICPSGMTCPSGPMALVAGTPFDFTTAKPIGQDISDPNAQLEAAHGYDNNWVLNPTSTPMTTPAAVASDPVSGRTLTIYTTQPGLQFYSGNYLVGQGAGCDTALAPPLPGPSGSCYRQGEGFALETQHFPDSPNEPSYPTTELDKGQVYSQTTIYQLTSTASTT